MALPLLAVLAASGFATSAAANLYSQYNSRRMYRPMANAYKNLDRGYRQYLVSQGRKINPDRAWTSYYGQYRKSQTNFENSYAGGIGTIGGTVGAGSYATRGLYKSLGGTSPWL